MMREDINVTKTCRLCLARVDENELVQIFSQNNSNGVSLVMQIMVCVPLTVREDDPFPKRICRECEKSVNKFYNFRESCCHAYFMLIKNIGGDKDSPKDIKSVSTEISDPPKLLERLSSKKNFGNTSIHNSEQHLTSNNDSNLELLSLQTKIGKEENGEEERFDERLDEIENNENCKTSSGNFDLEQNIPQHHIVCLDDDNRSVNEVITAGRSCPRTGLIAPEKTLDEPSFEESNLLGKNAIGDSENRSKVSKESKEDAESLKITEEFDSNVERTSLNSLNLYKDCYQVEEIHEHVLCGNYIKQRVRYRCLRCDNNFDDLESISAHYMEYCRTVDYQGTEQASAESNDADAGSNYLSAFQYLDENFQLESKEAQNLEYLSNEGVTEDADHTKQSQLSELRTIDDSVEVDRNGVVEKDEESHCGGRDLSSDLELGSYNRGSITNDLNSHNSKSDLESFASVSSRSCSSVLLEDNFNNGSGQLQMITLARVRKRKRNWSAKMDHPCPDCDRIFASSSLLKRHSLVHTGERPHVCEICDRRFTQIGQLNFHRKFHSNPRYRCHICSKPFLRPSDIEKHMRTHTGEKPYDCKVCLKSFAQLGALQQHMRIHSGEKPYSCEICGKRFSQKANKTKHVKIHREGEKPHTCQICGRSFSDLSEMELHRAGHGGGKPRKCDHCQDSFRKLSELNHHVRRFHTFEKQHKCMFCPKEFYSIYNLKQHVMVHTGQRPYACSKCNLKFTQKGNLTKHFERKHSEFVKEKNRYILVNDKSCDENFLFVEENGDDALDDQIIVEREETIQLEVDADLTKDHVEFTDKIIF